MTVKVAVNGFGRIGRNIVRAIHESGRKDIDVVAINDLGPVESNAHLLRYDSVHGRFPAEVKVDGDSIRIDSESFKVFAERDPAKLPWKDLGVDIVFESTGLFTDRDSAAKHIAAGARKVIITAPAKGPDVTLVLGRAPVRVPPALPDDRTRSTTLPSR
jgi:glyceraldehyde 3-phosphate dehydrogenase